MAYAESAGIAGFLNNLQQNLMAVAARKQQEEDDLRKMEAERAARLIDAGRIMYQPSASVAPLTLSGQPTISGDLNGFLQKPIPGLGIPEPTPAPVIPKAQPLTLQQQNEVLAAMRQGKEMPSRYVSAQPEIPSGDPSEVVQDEKGNLTKKWKKTELTPYQTARLEIERNRAKDLRSKYKQSEYLAAYTRAQAELRDNIEAMAWPTDDREQFLNDRVMEILEAKKVWDTTGKRPSAKPVVGNPGTDGQVKIRVKRLSTGETGTIDEKDFDPNKYAKL